MKKLLPLVVILFTFLSSACYFQEDVSQNQIAVKLYKNQIQDVATKPGGVYSEPFCYFCDLRKVDIDTQTFSVEDPEVLTKDNQAVGVKITIQARRKADENSIKNLLTNWSNLVDNGQFQNTISATAREGMKNGVRGFTLSQLLDDRNGLADAISAQLEEDAKKYSGQIVSVTIENIGPSAEYMAILSETANLKAQTDQELRRQDLINQQAANNILEQQKRVQVAEAQVTAEQAETNVQLEIASREGKLIAARNAVYQQNEQAYELERLARLKELFNDKTVYFVPEGTNLTTFFNTGNGQVVPVPQGP